MRITTLVLVASLWSSCASPVLLYKYRPNFVEQAQLVQDPASNMVELRQIVSYGRKGVIDEEYSIILSFEFHDRSTLVPKKVLEVEKDTAWVSVEYDILSVWNWEKENAAISGWIKVLSIGDDSIRIRERIKVHDERNERILSFRGSRTFLLNEAP